MFTHNPRPQLIGIVNITTDSFSDGGRFLAPDAAAAQARQLRAQGADIVELGPASSHPDAAKISAAAEIARLDPVLAELAKDEIPLGLDSPQLDVQRHGLKAGVALLNDIRGFPDATIYDALAASAAKLVVMHSIVDATRASRSDKSVAEVFDSVLRFFDERLARLTASGIARERIIIDPGMGFFLSTRPEPSLAVLARIDELRRRFGCPILISVSRKSFLRNAFARPDCAIAARTLAAELFAWTKGVDYIRTHDVAQLDQAMATIEAIAAVGARADGAIPGSLTA